MPTDNTSSPVASGSFSLPGSPSVFSHHNERRGGGGGGEGKG